MLGGQKSRGEGLHSLAAPPRTLGIALFSMFTVLPPEEEPLLRKSKEDSMSAHVNTKSLLGPGSVFLSRTFMIHNRLSFAQVYLSPMVMTLVFLEIAKSLAGTLTGVGISGRVGKGEEKREEGRRSARGR